jgi:Fe-S cluster assembly protein SufD
MAADLKLVRTPAEEALLQRFPAVKASLPGDAAVVGLREAAFDLLAKRGLPHRRIEEWKYTDLRALMRDAAPPAAKPDAAAVTAAFNDAKVLAAIDATRIAFLNGHCARQISDFDTLPQGVHATPLAEALAARHPLLQRMSPVEAARDNAAYALNAAFMADGAVIEVAAGTAPERPIHLRFLNGGAAAFSAASRVLVVIGKGASVTLIETHEGTDGLAYQPNVVVEIVAEDGATVRHLRVNAEGDGALALSTLAVRLGAHVAFDTVNVTVGAGVSRHQVFLTCAGEGTNVRINGATMLKGRQHADTTLLVEHVAPRCQSRELFKTVADHEGTGVFQGKIIVQAQAQKTDARMMSAALLLSEGAAMNNKPELEIFADDVQCGHGATCGALDENLLFYLMARGLPRVEAESLLVQAFLGEAIEVVEHEAAREALVELVSRWLTSRG